MLPSVTIFEHVEHQSLRRDGVRKSAALLIHGFPGTPAEMRPYADLLGNSGWTVSAPLLPGFGADLENLPKTSYQDWLRVTRIELHNLRAQHDHIIVIGNSMGGALATRLAAENTIDGLILLAPFWKLQGIVWPLIPVLRHLLPSFRPFRLFRPDFSDPNTQEAIRKFMPDIDLRDSQVQKSILNFAIPMRIIDQIRIAGMKAHEASAYVKCPTLVFQGSRDDLVKPQITRRFVRNFRGPLQYIELDGAHELHQPDAPFWEELVSALQDFTKRSEYEGL